MITCSVLIPTFRRTVGLERAARAVFAQAAPFAFELVIVDNSPEHGARETLAGLAHEAPIPLRYAHERRSGVAFARNALVNLAEGDILVWLDDDQEPEPGWLAALVATLTAQSADIAFGPVDACAPLMPGAEVYERLYSRAGAGEDHTLAYGLGIGNCAMRARLFTRFAPFDTATNETGGEDDVLFDALAQQGARFAWSARARVREHIDLARLNPRHALRRAFAYGQGPSERAQRTGDLATLVRHVLIGAAQTLAYAAAAALASLTRPDAALSFAEHAARGAGKALWFLPQRFYGVAARSPA